MTKLFHILGLILLMTLHGRNAIASEMELDFILGGKIISFSTETRKTKIVCDLGLLGAYPEFGGADELKRIAANEYILNLHSDDGPTVSLVDATSCSILDLAKGSYPGAWPSQRKVMYFRSDKVEGPALFMFDLEQNAETVLERAALPIRYSDVGYVELPNGKLIVNVGGAMLELTMQRNEIARRKIATDIGTPLFAISDSKLLLLDQNRKFFVYDIENGEVKKIPITNTPPVAHIGPDEKLVYLRSELSIFTGEYQSVWIGDYAGKLEKRLLAEAPGAFRGVTIK